MNKVKKKHTVLKVILIMFFLLIIVIVGGLVYMYYENDAVTLSEYTIHTAKINPVFDGYKLANVSDFHDSDNGDKIIELLREQKPNVIIIGGDFINANTEDYTNTENLLKEMLEIAPVYYTYGNHEVWNRQILEPDGIGARARALGVILLNDRVILLRHKGNNIYLAGYQDFGFSDGYLTEKEVDDRLTAFDKKLYDPDLFTILVYHRANYFDMVGKHPYDLVLSGHLHGGQINLPYVRNWILRRMFLTDKYCKGLYRNGNAQMVVSAGLERDKDAPRLFNPPEIVMITLNYMKR